MTLLFSLWLYGSSLLTACYSAAPASDGNSTAARENEDETRGGNDSAAHSDGESDALLDTATVSDSHDTDPEHPTDSETVSVTDTETQTLPGPDTDSETSLCGNAWNCSQVRLTSRSTRPLMVMVQPAASRRWTLP